MSLASAVWTLVAWLFASATIGFVAAWLIQMWRMREGKALARSLEVDSLRMRAAHDQTRSALERERGARVASDARVIDIQREIMALREQATGVDAAEQHRDFAEIAIRQDAAEHLQALQSQLADARRRTADLERECLALRSALATEADQQSALSRVQTALALEHTNLRAAHQVISDERANWERERDTLIRDLEAERQRRAGLEHHVRALEENALQDRVAHRAGAPALAETAMGAQPAVPAQADLATMDASVHAASDEDTVLAQRMAAQQLHELEDQIARGKRLAREHKAEVAGLKSRITDLEERLEQLWAQQRDEGPSTP